MYADALFCCALKRHARLGKLGSNERINEGKHAHVERAHAAVGGGSLGVDPCMVHEIQGRAVSRQDVFNVTYDPEKFDTGDFLVSNNLLQLGRQQSEVREIVGALDNSLQR